MLTLLSTFYLTIGYTILNTVPWSIVFLLLRPFGIRFYKLIKTEECKIIQKKIKDNSTHTTDNNKAYGYSFGYWYAMHIDASQSEYGDRYEIHLLTFESTYKELINSDNTSKQVDPFDEIVEKPKINIIERFGSFTNPWFKSRTIVVPPIIDREEQTSVLNEITKHYDKKKQSIVFLHGNPGSGKSMIGILLAKHYNGIYCNTFNPYQPNDILGNLYLDADPNETKPLIVVLEEIDIALLKIHEGIPLHKYLPISINNKTTWNQFMDNIQLGLYPNIILLLTSNKNPKFINDLDTAYLREGRVDLILELNN